MTFTYLEPSGPPFCPPLAPGEDETCTHTPTCPTGSSVQEPAFSDASPAPSNHDEGCEERCAHCALCGVPVLYGARCREHYGVYRQPSVPSSGGADG